MARTTHDPVLTADARSACNADAPIEAAATHTGAALLNRSSAPHIAPQLRALVIPIDCVELHPRNPRQGDVAAVAASLARFGQQKPIVVQRSTGYVCAGNHVLRAALSLGWTEIAANVEDLGDAEAIAFMLSDNRTADLGGYDDVLLAAILAEQQEDDNLAATGYDADDVATLLAQAGIVEERDLDAAPDLPADAELYVARGQTWVLGHHKLTCGDSTVAEDVGRLLGDEVVDLVWSSTMPPATPSLGRRRASRAPMFAMGARRSPRRDPMPGRAIVSPTSPRKTALAIRSRSMVRPAAARAAARTTVTARNERPNPARMPRDRRRPPVDAAPSTSGTIGAMQGARIVRIPARKAPAKRKVTGPSWPRQMTGR